VSDARRLIVNADDFGLSAGVNEGVVRAHVDGVVTSATLMVRAPAARQAAESARQHPGLSVGLHLDLGEWEYRDSTWHAVYEVVPSDDRDAVAAEIERQVAAFHDLMGEPPSHLDSHQHVHRSEPVRSLLAATGARLRVPVRDVTPTVRYCGDFYGQDGRGGPLPSAITVEHLVRLVVDLSPGVTELGCHPGLDDRLPSAYAAERAREVEVLCDDRVRRAIDAGGVDLVSFRGIGPS
jgi:chitin disaccharide deacetylase